ncbi:hypothetical protein D3C87_1925840 [compost metagenome]
MAAYVENFSTCVEIVTIPETPAAAARAITPSISAASASKSRWQWLSISMLLGLAFEAGEDALRDRKLGAWLQACRDFAVSKLAVFWGNAELIQ